MRNKFAVGLALVFLAFSFQSCDPWEDESYHPGAGSEGPDVIMLLKETKTESAQFEGVTKYSYDGQNRLTKVLNYTDITSMTNYTEAIYQYPSSNKIVLDLKTYVNGTLLNSADTTMEIINSTTATVVLNSELGSFDSNLTYSAPCGVNKAVTTFNFMGENITSTTTYDFTDGNCSYTEKVDGEWTETVFKDNKFSPVYDPMLVEMGIVSHNIIKVEDSEGLVETISYQYNENGYPTHATHTFNQNGTELNYTETFTYY